MLRLQSLANIRSQFRKAMASSSLVVHAENETMQKRKSPSQAQLVEEALFEAAGPIIDVGLNLGDKSFALDRRDVLCRARQAGVIASIVTGTSCHSSIAARGLVDDTNLTDVLPLFYTAGIHPHHAKTCDDNTIDELRDIAMHPKCVAIGECGLDYNRNFSPRDTQLECFSRQVQLAKDIKKPLLLHCRDAADEFTKVLEDHMPLGIPAVVHCFTGSEIELRRFIELGLYIGITGWITDERPDRGGLEVASLLPLIPKDRLMIETDSPYLSPRSIKPGSKRPGRNEPALLPHVLRAAAVAMKEEEESVALRTTANACRFFGLPLDSALSL